MKATVYHAPGDVRVEDVPDPAMKEPTDAIVRVTHACICGSDLWFYRGLTPYEPGWRTGHEWMGIVEEVGPGVRTIRKGDRVIAPFAFSDGECEFAGRACRRHVFTRDSGDRKTTGGRVKQFAPLMPTPIWWYCPKASKMMPRC